MAKGRDDLRLALGWVDHLKTRRLIDEVGERGALCLLRLWAYAAQNHPDGTFASTDDVEPAAGWRGRRGVLLSALIRLRWLEEDGVTLHDWREEQPWIAGKARRVASAKANAEARWNRKRDAEPTIPQCGSHSGTDADSMRTAENGNAPSPIPTPTPIPTPSPTRSPERAREPDPEQSPAGTGYATTPQSPQVEPTTGRSPRHLDGDPPVPAASPKRTAMDLAESLRKRTLCGLHEAAIAVESLLADGAPTEWVQQRILRTIGTPKPWDWGKAAKAAWIDHMDRVGVES